MGEKERQQGLFYFLEWLYSWLSVVYLSFVLTDCMYVPFLESSKCLSFALPSITSLGKVTVDLGLGLSCKETVNFNTHMDNQSPELHNPSIRIPCYKVWTAPEDLLSRYGDTIYNPYLWVNEWSLDDIDKTDRQVFILGTQTWAVGSIV